MKTARLAIGCILFLFVPLFAALGAPPNKNEPNKNVVLIKEITIPAAAAGQTQATHSANLTWTASTSVVAGYNVFKATGACPASGIPTGATKLNTALVTGTTYTDAGLTAPGTVCYYVVAVDSSGSTSAPSNTAAAVIPGPPASPTNLAVTITSP